MATVDYWAEAAVSLKAAAAPDAKVREDEGAYVFQFQEKIGPKDTIRFVKIGDRWYLRN